MCGSFSPRRLEPRDRRPAAARGPSAPPCSLEESNSSCMPRQMPSTGAPARGALAHQLVEPELARVAHRLREGAHAGHDEPVGRAQLAVVARDARARRRARAPSRRCGGCPSRSRPRAITRSASPSSTARPPRRVDRHRLAQRAREGLEARLDHVVRVACRPELEVQRQPRAVGDRAEELLGQLVLEAADLAGRQRRPSNAQYGPARRCRSRSAARASSIGTTAWP